MIAAPMLAQLGLGAAIVALRPDGTGVAASVVALALTFAIFALTFALAVPAQDRLGAGWDPAVGRRLVVVNAWRTAAWTSHAALAVAFVAAA